MRIGEVSARSGVSARSLRYYEQLGLIGSEREPNGYRRYDDSVVDRAIVIQMLFGMDFPREVVTSVLACTGEAPAAPAAISAAAKSTAAAKSGALDVVWSLGADEIDFAKAGPLIKDLLNN